VEVHLRLDRLPSAVGVADERLGEDLTDYVAEYERRMQSVQSDDPPVLHGPSEPWYPGPVEDDIYWPKLRSHFLDSLGWDDHRIHPVDHASSKVVAYTPSPIERSWASRGLIVGYVQSGKTTNFTSVIAKAADVGYKLVIVLSGIHNGLRKQTQQRLDEQLHDLNPASWMVLTDQADDFRGQKIGPTALLHNQEKVALCVVKKNAKVLTRLDNWLEDGVRARVFVGVPTLVVWTARSDSPIQRTNSICWSRSTSAQCRASASPLRMPVHRRSS
jgi:hypothetical protein